MKNLFTRILILTLTLFLSLPLGGCSLAWTLTNRQYYENVGVIDTIIKVDPKKGSQYIANLQIKNKIEPFEIANNFLGLGRLDRTTVLAYLDSIAKKNDCINVHVHGLRLPSFSYREIGRFSQRKCTDY